MIPDMERRRNAVRSYTVLAVIMLLICAAGTVVAVRSCTPPVHPVMPFQQVAPTEYEW